MMPGVCLRDGCFFVYLFSLSGFLFDRIGGSQQHTKKMHDIFTLRMNHYNFWCRGVFVSVCVCVKISRFAVELIFFVNVFGVDGSF